MTSHAHSGEANISKQFRNDKARSGVLAGAAAVLTGLALLIAGRAQAVPVTIGWDVPLSRGTTYQIEISPDAGFAKVLESSPVRGTGYPWNAPSEGVYHWRLARPNQPTAGGEVNTFVSGSFAVLDPAVSRSRPPRLSWAAVAGADHYKIFIVDAEAHDRVVVTDSPSVMLPTVVVAQTLVVVPYTGGRRTERSFHFDPSLTLDSGGAPVVPALPPPPPPTEVTQVLPSPSPSPAASPSPAPEVTATAAVATPTPAVVPNPERRRVHLVYIFGEGETETLRSQKLDVNATSTRGVGGGGGGFWVNPVAGLVLSGQGEYHEHKEAGASDPAVFPGRNFAMNASRYSADVELGYNLLSFFDVRRNMLTLSAAAGATQLPFLPLVFDSGSGQLPSYTNRGLNLFGGAASYGYLGSWGSLVAEGGILTETLNKGIFDFQRVTIEVYLGSHVSLEIGAFHRFTQGQFCAATADQCLSNGQVISSADELGGFLGLGAVFL